VTKNFKGTWYVEIDAHDKALPLMFDFKRDYFKYPLWSILRLNGSNQHRMYEVLKQYENLGKLTVTYEGLRNLMWVEPNEYVDKTTGKHRWNNFKMKVLDVCQKALAESTDIKFTYLAEKRGGLEKKITFLIERNQDYVRAPVLPDLMEESALMFEGIEDTDAEIQTLQEELGEEDNPAETLEQNEAAEPENFNEENEPDETGEPENENYFQRETFPLMSEACNHEFDSFEIQVLYNMIIKIIPNQAGRNRELEMHDYLKRRYDEMKWQESRKTTGGKIGKRFEYLRKMIAEDFGRVTG
jgi:hypothetical protein